MNTERVIEIIKSGKLDKFYKSREWMSTRLEVIDRDNKECQHCKRNGRYRRVDCVHHMQPLKSRPDLALDKGNLIALCNSCHNLEHPEKYLNKRKRKVIDIEEQW